MVDDRTARRRRSTGKIAQAYRDSQELMSVCVALGLMTAGGYWLDSHFGWMPIFTVTGVLLGLAWSAIFLRQFLRRLDERDQKKSEQSDG